MTEDMEHTGLKRWDSDDYPDYEEKLRCTTATGQPFFCARGAEELSVVERLLRHLRKDQRTRHYNDMQQVSCSLDGNDELCSPAIDNPKRDGEFLAIALISGDKEFLEATRTHLFHCTMAIPGQRPAEHLSHEGEDNPSQSEAYDTQLFLNQEEASRAYVEKREKAIRAVALDVLDTIPSEQELQELHEIMPGIKRSLETAPLDMDEAAKQALLDELREEKEELLQKVSKDRVNPTFAAREDERMAIRQRLRQL